MTKYFCYKKHPKLFVSCASFPSYKENMTFDEWVKRGKPTDSSIHFLGQDNQPPQLKNYWEFRKRKEYRNVMSYESWLETDKGLVDDNGEIIDPEFTSYTAYGRHIMFVCSKCQSYKATPWTFWQHLKNCKSHEVTK